MGKILVLGGYGKTAKRLAPVLHKAGASLVLSSRSGKVDAPFPHEVVRFDWTDPSNHEEILGSGIDKIWLVNPSVYEPLELVKPFIDIAKAKGVKRIVLLSATVFNDDSPGPGKVGKYLKESGIDYCLVKPSWFMQNFSEQRHLATIRDENKIISATNGGLIPWVSTEDIADVGAAALLADKSPNCDYTVRGPELLSYADCAKIFSDVLGRPVENIYIDADQFATHFESYGFPREVGVFMATLETHIAQGKEAELDNVVETVTGHKPRSFASFVEDNKQVWQK